MSGLLRADGLGVRYRAAVALDDVSMTVASRQVLAITGPSGSGKSTLLLCLAGIVRPGTGSVHLHGRDLSELPEGELSLLRRSAFGILFQFGQLIPEMTLGENVALPLLLAGRSRRDALSRAEDILERLDIAELSSSKPMEVSGGQAQRAALARAMITGPEVLLADEPTGALDSASGEVVLDEMTTLAREHGTAIVLVTHDLGVAARADRQMVLRDGKIVSDSATRSATR